MDRIGRYRRAIERILDEYVQIPYAYGDVDPIVVYDPAKMRQFTGFAVG
jgi:hypothetical protein